jgi:hypothetical protein
LGYLAIESNSKTRNRKPENLLRVIGLPSSASGISSDLAQFDIYDDFALPASSTIR